jgi:uncharacterized membrane protein
MSGAWSYFGWGWFLWGFLMFVTVASLVAVAPGGGKRKRTRPDEQQLREQYEHGEISTEEYRQRTHDLRRAA